MRRRGDACAALAAELNDGNGQRRALGGVRARAELVKQDEAVFVADLEDLYNILCMRRERGKRLLDGLLVADVGENLLIDIDRADCFLPCGTILVLKLRITIVEFINTIS